MIRKIIIFLLALVPVTADCKVPVPPPVDSVITAHYLFQVGTYWVYTDTINHTDSMYVAATGVLSGNPYMQINEVISGHSPDTIYASFTTYIGTGPTSTQLQQWSYDILNSTDSLQLIFDLDTPGAGAGSYVDSVAATCLYTGIGIGDTTVSGVTFHGPQATAYEITYNEPNINQYYGATLLVFYPNFGIIGKYCINSPLGNLALSLTRYHIIQ